MGVVDVYSEMGRHHTVVETEEFAADARHLKISEEEVTRIVTEVSHAPANGDVIKGAGGLRKVRIARGPAAERAAGIACSCFISTATVQLTFSPF